MANDGDEDARFGSSIAISGNTAVVGAIGFKGTNGDVFAGAVYIFVNDGTQWVEQAKLVLPDGQERDLFGKSVAISGDRVLVGSPQAGGDDDDTGAAYVFARNGIDEPSTNYHAHACERRASESRMRENRVSGLMRGGCAIY